MRIRGERECRDCGSRWSYYETGRVNCPDCGSIASKGLDGERALHTAGTETLDLARVRAAMDEQPLRDVAREIKDVCRAYVRQDGFVRGGHLRSLDDTHLAARELVHVTDLVGRSTDADGAEELYLLALLGGADDGERPGPEEVPASLRGARGLAAAEGVLEYRREFREWLGDDPDPDPDPDVPAALVRLDQVAKRVIALQGNVPPATAERLVAAARDLATAAREDDATALATATDRLGRLESTERS